MRKSLFMVVHVKTSEMKRGLIIPMPLFVLDEVIRDLAGLAELVLRLAPGLERRLSARLGAHPIEWIRMTAGLISEMRAYGRLTLVDVETADTRIYIKMY